MKKEHVRRLENLEAARKVKKDRFDQLGILYYTVAPGMERALEEKEKWVADWYVETDGRISEVRLRIAADSTERGRNYRRDTAGNETEDSGLERRVTKPGRGGISWVVTKPGIKPFPTRIGRIVMKYA
jgi:hypothetical protein